MLTAIAQTTTMTSLLQGLAAAAKLSLVLILFLPACTVYWLPTEYLVKTTFSRRLNAAHSILFDTRHAGAKGHDSFSETVTYVSFASGRNSASPRPLQTHSTKERVETAEVTLDSARRTKRQTLVHGNASSQQTASTTNNISTNITTQQTPMGNVCTLMTTRTTGDLLDDADAEDFIREGQLWTTDSSIKNETRPILKQITEDGMISQKAYRTFSRVVRYVSYPLILVGLVTNGIALKVFRRMPGTVTNTYMKCLIIFDVAYLLSVVSSYIIVAALKDHVDGSVVHYLYSLHTYLILGARQVIVCATTFMCLDRFLALACPLKRVKIVVLRNPKPLIAAVSVVIFLYNSHKLLKREIKSGVFSDTNQTMSYLGYTQIYAENRRLIDDLTIASTIMFQYLPLIVMTAANISLVASLHKYSRRASAVELQIKRTFRLRQVSKESDSSSTSSNSEAKPVTSVSPRVFDIQNETPKQMNLIKTRSNSLECNGQTSDGFRQKLTKSRSNSYDGETDKSTEKAPNSFENKDKILNGLKFKVTKSRSNSLQKGERTHRERKSNASKSLQFFQIERHKSVTVIVYSILFLLLALPLALFPLLQRLAPEFDAFKREHYLFLVYTRVISLLHIISASINFFVFFIKGRAFRSGVHEVCRCEHNGKKRETFRIQPSKTAVLDGSA